MSQPRASLGIGRRAIELRAAVNNFVKKKAVSPAPVPCMNCGSSEAVFIGTRTSPDFDLKILPSELASIFGARKDGICACCGLYQDYIRLDRDQQRRFCESMISKDRTVSEEAFHTYPVPPQFIADFDARYYALRLKRWRDYMSVKGIAPKRCLFLRPMFGAAPEFVVREFGADVSGLEISSVAMRTTIDRVPGFKPLSGCIHGYLEGDFLNSGHYDAIFCFHSLVHSVDIHDMIGNLRKLLAPGGCIIFTHEINRKPTNPFHILYTTEWVLESLLTQHFSRVERIDDCEEIANPVVNPFTKKKDHPDIVAWA